MSEGLKLGALDPVTVHCYSLVMYHDFAMVIMSGVMTFILLMMTVILISGKTLWGYTCRYMYRNDFWEFWWATIPMFLLISMGIWSWANLYAMEVGGNVKHHAKVIGHQWYWEYEYFVDYNTYNSELSSFFSYIGSGLDSDMGGVRDLESCMSFCWVWYHWVDHEVSDLELLKPSKMLKPYSVGHSQLFYMLQVEKDNEKKLPLKYKINKVPVHDVPKSEKFELLTENKNWGSSVSYEKVGLNECYKEGYLGSWLEIVCGSNSINQCVYNFDSYTWDIFGEISSSDQGIDSRSEFDFLMTYDRNATTTRDFFLPMDEVTEISISTADVIHSWGVPSLGVKMDAVPGRLNHIGVAPLLPGVYGGNCYELCGYGHSVMPINVITVMPDVHRNLMQYLAVSSY
nr:cytochrome c oxidase subunit 2 [Pholas orientalis]